LKANTSQRDHRTAATSINEGLTSCAVIYTVFFAFLYQCLPIMAGQNIANGFASNREIHKKFENFKLRKKKSKFISKGRKNTSICFLLRQMCVCVCVLVICVLYTDRGFY
jgi:hypothetical protein